MKLATHPDFIYRVGRGDPWAIWPPRMHNRFDISNPGTSRDDSLHRRITEAALAEVLAPLRPDLETIAAVSAIPSDDDQEPLAGVIPKAWIKSRQIGKAKIRPQATLVGYHPT